MLLLLSTASHMLPNPLYKMLQKSALKKLLRHTQLNLRPLTNFFSQQLDSCHQLILFKQVHAKACNEDKSVCKTVFYDINT